MNNDTSLLCTFTTVDELDDTLKNIVSTYSIAFDSIYILENVDTPCAICCTYNILLSEPINGSIPPSTISLHRKKSTNTLYTINALNRLVESLHGNTSKNFQIPWETYRNTILVTAYNQLKVIHTKLDRIVKTKDITDA